MVTCCYVAPKAYSATKAVKLWLEKHVSVQFWFYCQDFIKVPHHQFLWDNSHPQPFLKLPAAVELGSILSFCLELNIDLSVTEIQYCMEKRMYCELAILLPEWEGGSNVHWHQEKNLTYLKWVHVCPRQSHSCLCLIHILSHDES